MATMVDINKAAVKIFDSRFETQIRSFILHQYDFSQMDQLLELLSRQGVIGRHYAIISLRKIISRQEHVLDLYVRTATITKIIEMAKLSQYHHIRFEATWILTNVASGTSQHTQILQQFEVIQIFINALQSQNSLIIQESLWGLANMAADQLSYRNQIIMKGLGHINQVMKCQLQSRQFESSGTRLISNLCSKKTFNLCKKSKSRPPYQYLRQSILILIQIFTKHQLSQHPLSQTYSQFINVSHQCFSGDTLANILWPLSFYCSQPQIHNNLLKTATITKIPTVILILIENDKQFLGRCKELLYHYRGLIRQAAMRTVESICLGSQANLRMLVEGQIMGCVLQVFDKNLLPQQQAAVCCYINLLRSNSPNQFITNLLQTDFNSIIFCKMRNQKLRKSACEFVFQVLQFCLTFIKDHPFLGIIFDGWKCKWQQINEVSLMNTADDQSLMEIIIRTKCMVDFVDGQIVVQ